MRNTTYMAGSRRRTSVRSVSAAPPGSPEPLSSPGRLIAGRYRVVRLVGSGGMASVYEAVDERLGRRVAVKELHEHLVGHDVLSARFGREALAIASVNHPAIVSIYDSVAGDRDEGIRPALVMEYVDGRTLRDFLDENGALESSDVVTLGTALCDALGAVHAAGLVHRDLTPSNVLLCRNGEVKLADFGIAKTDEATDLTATGALIGTARYLSPEQLTDRPVDRRSDLYALGLVLYEAATGQRPFHGSLDAAVALARLENDPASPSAVDHSVPMALSTTIMWALNRDPAERPDSAADLSHALLAAEDAEIASTRGAATVVDTTAEMPMVTTTSPTVSPSLNGGVPAPSPAQPAEETAPRRRSMRISTLVVVALAASALATALALVGIIR